MLDCGLANEAMRCCVVQRPTFVQYRKESYFRAIGATLEALIAAFCRLDKSLSCCWEKGWLVGAVGIELLRALKTRRLLILQNGKREKNRKNAEAKDTPGTRADSEICPREL